MFFNIRLIQYFPYAVLLEQLPPPGPPSESFIITEDGNFILSENGDSLVTE